MRASAASILAISLRWRSRARSSSARSVSDVARSARSACCVDSSCSPSQRLARLADDLFLPGQQLLAEVHPLALVHERLVLARTVVRGSTIDEDLARAVIFFPATFCSATVCQSTASCLRACSEQPQACVPGIPRRPCLSSRAMYLRSGRETLASRPCNAKQISCPVCGNTEPLSRASRALVIAGRDEFRCMIRGGVAIGLAIRLGAPGAICSRKPAVPHTACGSAPDSQPLAAASRLPNVRELCQPEPARNDPSPPMKFEGTRRYVATDDLKVAVNAAITLSRPLLIKGEPGTGKTALALEVAEALGVPIIEWHIKSTTKAHQGLYEYDAVSRLRDSQLGDAARPRHQELHQARQAVGSVRPRTCARCC